MTALGAFNTQLIRFFEELVGTYPEEKEIKMGLEAIQGAKKINPKLILDLFGEHVYNELHTYIKTEDEEYVLKFAHSKITNQFNEMSCALIILDKYWGTMTEANQKAIWNYLKVLCILYEKAKASRGF